MKIESTAAAGGSRTGIVRLRPEASGDGSQQSQFPSPQAWALAMLLVFLTGIETASYAASPLHETPAETPVQRSQSVPSNQIVFDTDILPILKNRCFECHAQENSDGDLRLDHENFAIRGGHTGRPVIGATPEQSELYRRITSAEDGYQMPKAGDRLSESEIQRFKAWIEQGADWGNLSVKPNRPAFAEKGSGSIGSVQWFAEIVTQLNEMMARPRYRFLGPVLWLAIGWLLLTVIGYVVLRWQRSSSERASSVRFAEGSERELSSGHPQRSWLVRVINGRTMSVALIAIVGLGAVLLQQGIIAELHEKVRLAESKVRRQEPIQITENRSALAWPVDPAHPPRMGGLYYRGNDERNPALFNNGIYRTATLELWLVDQDRNRLQWGSDVAGKSLFISLTIKRAPKTTAALFTEFVFEETYLRRFRETGLIPDSGVDESTEVQFATVEPEQEWNVLLPVEPIEQWQDSRNAGMVYLFYGSQMYDGFRGRVHFGIRYDVRLAVDQNAATMQIDPDSQLWMGCMYDLGGRVLIPQEKEIRLDHWFDYRPIPEIETDNPDDAELLGLPEHLK